MTEERKRALLVIDMLNDFVKEGAPLEVPDTRKIVDNIRKRVEKARAEGVPVIFLCDNHSKDDPEFKVWPQHAVEGTDGAEVVEELKPMEDDLIVPKTTYSGFYDTELDSVLKGLGVEKVILTGCVTNICILYTAVDAFMRGYYVSVPEDCVAGLEDGDHRFALKQINKLLKPRLGN